MIIAIEGMDGSGKSTIARKLSEANDFVLQFSPNKSFFGMTTEEYGLLCNRVYSLKDERLKAWFFGFGNLIQATKNIDRGMILDRHLLSNYFWNGTERSENIYKLLLEILGKPDLTIILYASAETRAKRIHERDVNDKDLSDPKKFILGYDKMIKFAKSYKLPFLIINTEKFSENQVFKICNSLINKIKNLTSDQVFNYCSNINKKICEYKSNPYSQYLV